MVTNLKKNKAFSLVELSISLVVIGTLMAIVAGSTKLIASSRLTSARSLTARSPVPKIEGLVAWYETSRRESFKPSETVDGGQISAWYDVSPGSITKQKNTLTRTASSAVTYQSNGINKIPSVNIDGTGKISVTSFYQGTSTQNTIFFVTRPYVLGGNTGTVIDSGAINTTAVALVTGGIHAYWGLTGDATASNCCSTNENYIIAFYANRSSSKSYVNNATTMTGGSTVNPGTNILTGLTVGADAANSYNLTGLVSEVIVYNRPLQTQERKDVMNYLSQKYGITITGI